MVLAAICARYLAQTVVRCRAPSPSPMAVSLAADSHCRACCCACGLLTGSAPRPRFGMLKGAPVLRVWPGPRCGAGNSWYVGCWHWLGPEPQLCHQQSCTPARSPV
jgi:hypothetical protein